MIDTRRTDLTQALLQAERRIVEAQERHVQHRSDRHADRRPQQRGVREDPGEGRSPCVRRPQAVFAVHERIDGQRRGHEHREHPGYPPTGGRELLGVARVGAARRRVAGAVAVARVLVHGYPSADFPGPRPPTLCLTG